MAEAERREAARLAELDYLGAVRPDADLVLQELVDDAREAFGADLCMVNLVLSEEQYFRAWSGELPAELAEARRAPIEQSMCRYVVDAELPLVVEDLLAAERFGDRNFRLRLGFRSYAGTPLVTSGGHAIGALCVLSKQPSRFGKDGLTLLAAFAKAAVGRLETLGALERERAAREEEARHASRLENERALRQSEERFRAMVQYGSDIITILEADGTVRYTSLSIERVLGYRPEERIGAKTLDDVHPEDAERVSRAFAEGLAHWGLSPPLEYRFRHADGSWRYLETIGNNLLDDPDVRGIVVSSRDVTDRKLAEQKLRDSEKKYRLLMEQASDGVFIGGLEGNFIEVNPKACEMLGYTEEELLRLGVRDVIAAEDLAETPLRLDEVRSGKTLVIERRLRRADGTLLPVEASAKMLGDGRLYATVRDITERKQTEKKLREAEAKYRRLVEQMPVGTYVLDLAVGRLTYVSPQMEAMLGYSSEDETFDFENWLRRTHPEDRERLLAEVARATRTGEPFELEYRHIARDGRVVWVKDEAVLVRDEAGNPRYRQGIKLDITERKRAEEELVRLASFPELNPNPVLETDPAGEPTYLNPAAIRIFPDLPARGSGHPVLAGVGSAVADLGSDSEPVTREVEAEGAFYRQTISRVPGGGGLHLYMMDITERKALEEELAYRAFHDPLTDLPNRRLLMDRLEHALARTERRDGTVAVLYVDLDDFKLVNDSFGHGAGDQLLISVGQRLCSCLRPEDTVARLGGDEFAVLLEDGGIDEAIKVAERIAKELRTPFALAGQELDVTASIGIVAGSVGDRPDDLLNEADLAMYRAKKHGKARHEISHRGRR